MADEPSNGRGATARENPHPNGVGPVSFESNRSRVLGAVLRACDGGRSLHLVRDGIALPTRESAEELRAFCEMAIAQLRMVVRECEHQTKG